MFERKELIAHDIQSVTNAQKAQILMNALPYIKRYSGKIVVVKYGAAGLFPLLHAMGDGITSMGELIIVTMLAGGMFEVVRRNGGIEYIIERISSRISGKRGAESVIALLVAIVDVCTANNTVAIISVGNIAKRISQKYSIDNRRAASILDTSSCCVQAIIPYGAQMLMASGLSQLAPMEIIPYLYYPMALIVCVALSIVVRYPKKYA